MPATTVVTFAATAAVACACSSSARLILADTLLRCSTTVATLCAVYVLRSSATFCFAGFATNARSHASADCSSCARTASSSPSARDTPEDPEAMTGREALRECEFGIWFGFGRSGDPHSTIRLP